MKKNTGSRQSNNKLPTYPYLPFIALNHDTRKAAYVNLSSRFPYTFNILLDTR